MDFLLSPQAWLMAALIFGLRVLDMTLDTLRVLFVMRGRKKIAWVLGFFQSAIFVIAISTVLSNLDNPLNIIGYAAGFATGNVVGMVIEERLAIGHTMINIISSAPRISHRRTPAQEWLRRDRDPRPRQGWHGHPAQLHGAAQECGQGAPTGQRDRSGGFHHRRGCPPGAPRFLARLIYYRRAL